MTGGFFTTVPPGKLMYVDSTKNKGEKNQNKAERPYLLFIKLSAIKTFVTAGEKKKERLCDRDNMCPALPRIFTWPFKSIPAPG